jgi:hypothetical protein
MVAYSDPEGSLEQTPSVTKNLAIENSRHEIKHKFNNLLPDVYIICLYKLGLCRIGPHSPRLLTPFIS